MQSTIRVTGYLAEPFDVEDLSAGIHWVLDDPRRFERLGKAARARTMRLWSPSVVGGQYLEVFRSVVTQKT